MCAAKCIKIVHFARHVVLLPVSHLKALGVTKPITKHRWLLKRDKLQFISEIPIPDGQCDVAKPRGPCGAQHRALSLWDMLASVGWGRASPGVPSAPNAAHCL